MAQLIALPTHNKNHILDWIITKDCDIDTIKNTQVLKKLVSDQHLILFEFDAEKPPKVKRKITSRNLKTINIEKFKSDVKTELQTIDPINIQNLNDALSRILNQHAPVTSKQLAERISAPWLRMRQAKRERRGAENQWLKSGLNIDRDIYNAKRQNVKTCIRNANEDHFSDRLKGSKSCKQLFGICDELLGRTKQRCFPSKI
ncbi:ATP-dependent DNA helicase [Elysia marginata]|uniref:ATP-dependent DNA helicase n=1 Tax=Elysia marginata TaxID=1093978 RepID=A0AAV4GJI7_9GAST|nr:ATP-dependent DNA helicase [Elysia marginata]